MWHLTLHMITKPNNDPECTHKWMDKTAACVRIVMCTLKRKNKMIYRQGQHWELISEAQSWMEGSSYRTGCTRLLIERPGGRGSLRLLLCSVVRRQHGLLSSSRYLATPQPAYAFSRKKLRKQGWAPHTSSHLTSFQGLGVVVAGVVYDCSTSLHRCALWGTRPWDLLLNSLFALRTPTAASKVFLQRIQKKEYYFFLNMF